MGKELALDTRDKMKSQQAAWGRKIGRSSRSQEECPTDRLRWKISSRLALISPIRFIALIVVCTRLRSYLTGLLRRLSNVNVESCTGREGEV